MLRGVLHLPLTISHGLSRVIASQDGSQFDGTFLGRLPTMNHRLDQRPIISGSALGGFRPLPCEGLQVQVVSQATTSHGSPQGRARRDGGHTVGVVTSRLFGSLNFLEAFIEPTCGNRGIVDNFRDKFRIIPNQFREFLADFQNESLPRRKLLLPKVFFEIAIIDDKERVDRLACCVRRHGSQIAP